MASEPLPDFDHSLAMAKGNLDAAGLAECHGVSCGLLVRQPDCSSDAYLGLLALLEIAPDPGPAFREVLGDLLEATRGQLTDEADIRNILNNTTFSPSIYKQPYVPNKHTSA